MFPKEQVIRQFFKDVDHSIRELRQKGIQDQVIADVLGQIDESALALKAARKKARRFQSLEWQDFRKKMNGFLARRGFHYGVISEVLPKVWEELQE